MPMLEFFLPAGVILLLLAINGLFVAAEFALLGVPAATVEMKAEEGHRVARLMRLLLKDVSRRDQYIATAQLGITLASLGLGGYGEHVIAEGILWCFRNTTVATLAVAHTASTLAAIAALTYLHIVFGEMIPKTLALRAPWKTASWIAPVTQWTTRLAYPLVLLLNGMGNLLLKALGIKRAGEAHGRHSSEELQHIVKESQAAGKLTPEAGRFLQEVFDFDKLLAREVLVPRVRVAGIPLGADPERVARIFRESPRTRYPVYRETIDKIVGMVHLRDVFNLIGSGKSLQETDMRPVPFVPESASLNQVLDAMRRERTQICVILDEFGGTEGIITLGDLFREVVGKVPEGAFEVGEIIEDGQGRILAAGTVRLAELGERAGIRLEHPEVDTVSGLVLDLLGGPPKTNDKVSYGGLDFRVTSTEGKGVRWCEVRKSSYPSSPHEGGQRERN
jgi:CBS domain containing-hemolysin-like protein